jgi:hypothetical protein
MLPGKAEETYKVSKRLGEVDFVEVDLGIVSFILFFFFFLFCSGVGRSVQGVRTST